MNYKNNISNNGQFERFVLLKCQYELSIAQHLYMVKCVPDNQPALMHIFLSISLLRCTHTCTCAPSNQSCEQWQQQQISGTHSVPAPAENHKCRIRVRAWVSTGMDGRRSMGALRLPRVCLHVVHISSVAYTVCARAKDAIRCKDAPQTM